MGNTLLSLLVKLGVDSGDFDKGIGDAEKKAASFSDSMKKTGSQLMGIGAGLTAGLTLPIVGAATAMVSAASDLSESTNAVNVVFGEASDTIQAFGKTAAQSAGLATSEFNQMAAQTGAFLKNVGFSADGAADRTIMLTKRAADMASIFNTDVSQALAAIQSGLKGEFNPLEAFGVKLNAAAIEARALQMGLAKTKDELTDSMKAQAALALVMEQTDQFAGDFVNTADGLANSTRILKAELTNAAAALGEKLLPYVLQGVQFVSKLIDQFTALDPSGQNMILIVGGIAAAIGPLITGIGGLITAVGAISSAVGAAAAAVGISVAPFLLIVAAVIAVVALLAVAWTQNWGDIQGKTAAFWAWLQPILQELWNWLSVNVPAAISALSAYWSGTLLPAIMTVYNFLAITVFPLFQAIAGFMAAEFKLAIAGLTLVWQGMSAAFSDAWKIITALFTALKQNLSPAFAELSPVLEWIGNFLGTVFTNALSGVLTFIGRITDAINGMTQALNSISLPPDLTPGSPTPFEIGLWGIDAALKSVAGQSLPSLQMGLEASPEAVSGGWLGINARTSGMTGQDTASPSRQAPSIDYDRLADAFTIALQRNGIGQ